MRRLLLWALLLASAAPARAGDDDALLLADQAQTSAVAAADWRVFTEFAAGLTEQRYGLPAIHGQRWSLDMKYDKALAPGVRLVLSDRFDLRSQDKFAHHTGVNTPREGYLSWQASDSRLFDAGWINLHNGAASGYNPTDYFRDSALRSVSSVDMVSLRENRLGSAMLRGQQLWKDGAFSAVYSPRLAARDSASLLAPRTDATNGEQRWLLALSQKVADTLDAQVLLFGAGHGRRQLGLNLNGVVNDATVYYGEWSGGREAGAFRSRLAAGFIYTTPYKLSLLLEYDYNGAALDRRGWKALQAGPPADYVRYRHVALLRQDPVTKQSIFFHAKWQDALFHHLDLRAIVRHNLADRSRMSWLEARYHRDRLDLAIQWQLNGGAAGSEFGALPQARNVQAMAIIYF
ncbi:MAG: hypothetical protein V4633_24470 [Pseudomonadota bacterium]